MKLSALRGCLKNLWQWAGAKNWNADDPGLAGQAADATDLHSFYKFIRENPLYPRYPRSNWAYRKY